MKISETFYVGFRMVYSDLTLKNSELLGMFVDTAGIHSELCGNEFRKTDIRWLLTGYNVKMFKRPQFDDRLTITTWATEVRNVRSLREFEIKNQNGELVAQALSSWVSVNQKTKMLEKISPEKMIAYGAELNCTNFSGESIGRIEEETDYDKSVKFKIDWRFCDLIGHVNNTSYVDIAEHIIGERLKNKTQTMNFEIIYKKEIQNNVTINVYVKEKDDEIKIIFKSGDDLVLHAMIRYYK